MIVLAIIGFAAMALGCGALLAMLGIRPRCRLPKGALAVLSACAIVCAVHSGKNQDNNDNDGGEGRQNAPQRLSIAPSDIPVPTVTDADVARGFAVMGVSSNEVFDFSMPSNAARCEKWWIRGASDDWWQFPRELVLAGGEIWKHPLVLARAS